MTASDDARYQRGAEREPPRIGRGAKSELHEYAGSSSGQEPAHGVRRRPAAAEERAHESTGGSEGGGIHPTSHHLVGDFGQSLDRGADRSGKSAEHQPDERTGGGVKPLP